MIFRVTLTYDVLATNAEQALQRVIDWTQSTTDLPDVQPHDPVIEQQPEQEAPQCITPKRSTN
jgi:hypothetical protein